MLSTPKKEGTMDKQHRNLARDRVTPRRLIFPDMNDKFDQEQAKNDTMYRSLKQRQHSTSPGIEMGIGKGKLKRTPCNCPNCVNRVSKR
jgi:hypothetical protein